MNTFLTQFLGTTDLPTYMAWFILAFIGAVLGILLREITPLKNYKVTQRQMLLGFLITFISLRFSQDVFGLVPTSWGAVLIGLGHNEIALNIMKKKLNETPVKQ